MSKIVYIGETNHLFTKDKIYDLFFEGVDFYHVIGNDTNYISYMSKKDGIYLDKWRESRINKILEQ